MTLLEFFASIVDSLAWPVSLVFCLYILRVPAGKLIERVTKLKYGELEAEFQERLKKIDQVSEGSIKELKQEQGITSISLEDLSAISPRAAILEAWIVVEKATLRFCEANGLPPNLSNQGIFSLSEENGLDIGAFQNAYQELRLLRNKAVHATDSDITPSTAKQYVKTAYFIAAELGMRSTGA